MSVSAIDLFCGVGGLTRGIEDSGITVKAGFDLDESCRYAYEYNNKSAFIQCDIRTLDADTINSYFDESDIKVIVGCAPCQPFSSCTPRTHAGKKNDKWGMLNHYSRIVREVKPDIISMENVPQLKSTEPFEQFLKTLEDNEYHYSYSVVSCEEYGIPQRRKRLILLASRYGPIFIKSPNGIQKRTVKDVIGSLPALQDGEISSTDSLHRCQKLSEKNRLRISHSIPGGSWETWPDELKLDCHRTKNGSSFKSVYGRMRWDDSSPTITTEFFNYGSGRFGHPEQNRALSLREGALIQTFPADYEFEPGNDIKSIATTATHIGNAVPVKLGEIIGTSILEHLSVYGVTHD